MDSTAKKQDKIDILEFIKVLSDHSCKDNSKAKDLGKSLLVSGVLSLIGMPFGFRFARVYRSETSEQMQKRLKESIFNDGIKNAISKHDQYVEWLNSLDTDQKLKVLVMASKEADEYLTLIKTYFC